MELKRVNITNYRSIDDIKIHVNHRSLTFLGINESGKSNILKAISTISDKYVPNFDEDSKIPVDDEDYNPLEPVVEFEFTFSDNEKRQILNSTFQSDTYKEWIVKYDSNRYSGLADFVSKSINQANYKITIDESSQKSNKVIYFVETSGIIVKSGYKICNTSTTISSNGTQTPVEKDQVIKLPEEIDNWETIKQCFSEINSISLKAMIGKEIGKFVRENIPPVVYWRFDEKKLMTDSININEFKEDPSKSVPLQNIFHLAGIEEISERITKLENNDNAFSNLLDTLSKAATNHLRNVWKDYKEIELIVKERRDKLSIYVKDSKNQYSLSRRSDGFKRFVSFLLMLSAENESGQLADNSILIFDEPDVSLHPSGIRYLMKEILRLGQNNYCFTSTHSPFFIDRDNISRHIIVEKHNESTEISTADIQNFTEEEVLYRALGSSLFDILKQKNICFEGWTDKELFKTVSSYFKDDISELNKFNTHVGILWSSGATKICQTIQPYVNNDDRIIISIADFDGPGKQEQEKFNEEFGNTKSEFLTYKDFTQKHNDEFTVEDLLPQKVLVDFFNQFLKETVGTVTTKFTASEIGSNGILHAWKAFCSKNYKSEKNTLINKYKNRIPKHITTYLKGNENTDLKDQFSPFIKYINDLITICKL